MTSALHFGNPFYHLCDRQRISAGRRRYWDVVHARQLPRAWFMPVRQAATTTIDTGGRRLLHQLPKAIRGRVLLHSTLHARTILSMKYRSSSIRLRPYFPITWYCRCDTMRHGSEHRPFDDRSACRVERKAENGWGGACAPPLLGESI